MFKESNRSVGGRTERWKGRYLGREMTNFENQRTFPVLDSIINNLWIIHGPSPDLHSIEH